MKIWKFCLIGLQCIFANCVFVGGSKIHEFDEFEPCLKSAKNGFQLSASLNIETLNTILSETNHILTTAQIR